MRTSGHPERAGREAGGEEKSEENVLASKNEGEEEEDRGRGEITIKNPRKRRSTTTERFKLSVAEEETTETGTEKKEISVANTPPFRLSRAEERRGGGGQR